MGEILENDKSYAIFSRFRIFSSLEILFVRFLYRLDIYLVFFDLLNECSKCTMSACSRFKPRRARCCSHVGLGSSLFYSVFTCSRLLLVKVEFGGRAVDVKSACISQVFVVNCSAAFATH